MPPDGCLPNCSRAIRLATAGSSTCPGIRQASCHPREAFHDCQGDGPHTADGPPCAAVRKGGGHSSMRSLPPCKQAQAGWLSNETLDEPLQSRHNPPLRPLQVVSCCALVAQRGCKYICRTRRPPSRPCARLLPPPPPCSLRRLPLPIVILLAPAPRPPAAPPPALRPPSLSPSLHARHLWHPLVTATMHGVPFVRQSSVRSMRQAAESPAKQHEDVANEVEAELADARRA